MQTSDDRCSLLQWSSLAPRSMSATRECVYMPPGHTLHVGRSTPPASLLGPSVAAFIVTGATEGWAGIGRLLRRIVRWRVGLAPGYVAHVPAAPGPWTWR